MCCHGMEWLKKETGLENTSVPKRAQIHAGLRVKVIEKQNQPTGLLTEGIVQRILTSSPTHPHGIKVMLVNGKVGRVQEIVD
jgi:uncharacterized repeat protein (TIGR03833 family)